MVQPWTCRSRVEVPVLYRGVLALVVTVLVWVAIVVPVRADVVLGSATCAAGPGPVSGCAGVSAYGGTLLWSSFEPASGLFRLVTIASPGAAPQVLPVPGRPVPFDADVGPDTSGHAVAVYARCAGEPGGPSRGCGLFRLDLARARETRALPRVLTPPPLPVTIWRDRIAFSAARARDGLRHPTVCRLAARTRSCRTLPGGPPGGRPTAPTTGGQRLDLRGRALVFSWYSNPGPDALIRQTRVLFLRDVSATRLAPVELAKAGAGGAGNAAVFSPVLDDRAVYYARGGATCDYGSTPNTFGRYDLRTRTRRELPSPRTHGIARVAGSLIYEACPDYGRTPGPTGTTITRAAPDPFAVAPPPLVARACPARGARAAGWRAPVTLFARGGNPALAMAPNGTLAVAAGAPDGIRVRVRRPDQRRFGAPVLIRAVNAGSAQIAIDGAGHVIVAWETSAEGQGQPSLIQAAVSDRRGRFGAPQTLREVTGPEATSSHGLILASNAAGDAIAVWSLRTSVEAAARPAGGAFGPGETIWSVTPPDFGYSFGHAAGMDAGGGVLAVWPVQRGGAGTLETSVRPPGGSFTPPAPLASGTPSLAPAAALASDGSGVVAWIGLEGRYRRVMIARRRADGSFAPSTAVSPPEAPVVRLTPAVAAVVGHAVVVWAEHAEEAGRVEVASLDGSGAFDRQPFTAHRGSVWDVEAAINAHGDAAVAWELRCRGAGRRIMAATRRGGRTFAASRSLSGTDASVQAAPWSPLLGIDGSGHAAMVWDRIDKNRVLSRFAETTR
jgi:hypothetical protein